MLIAHRKSPNREREMRERVVVLVRERIGGGVICARCGATYFSYADRCSADLGERCAGSNAIELLHAQAMRELGLS